MGRSEAFTSSTVFGEFYLVIQLPPNFLDIKQLRSGKQATQIISYWIVHTIQHRIKSESGDLDLDSRRIVSLVFVASDIPTSKQASL